MISNYPAKRTWVFMECYKCKSSHIELYISLGQFNYNGFRCLDCKETIDF